ncbi:MAG: PilZ domain-containing protein [Myxococcota bacterium]
MTRTPGQPTHFRGKPRPGRRVRVHYRPLAESGGNGEGDGSTAPAIESVTHNLGVGGAFIASAAPLPVGSELWLALHLPTAERAIAVRARVRWQLSPAAPDSDSGDPRGMGVEFLAPDTDALLALGQYFASLTGCDIDSEV